jgi:ABC-type nitrate/sulfonate/bicarbonate transport system substrate-binding protein
MRGLALTLARVVLVTTAMSAAAAHAADTITVGTVGSASANLWPVFIGMKKGFYAEQDLKVDLVYVQSSAQTIQQLTAGALDITMSTGLVDPIRAIDKGAPIAIVRIETQAPPYALVAKTGIKSLAELKGKTISLGGPKDITKIYVERMLAPSGVNAGEFDMVFAGATSARASALLSGAVDAAILLPPFNFQATAAGFNELGRTVDYVKDLPFTGTVVNATWAKDHGAILQRLVVAHNKSVAWFEDEHNRAEAVQMMAVESKLKPEEVEKSYDFYRDGHFFEPAGKVSRAKLQALATALEDLGDLSKGTDIGRMLLPGVTQVSE